MQHKQNQEHGWLLFILGSASAPETCCRSTGFSSACRFGVSQTSEGSSRSSMENGGRERDHGSESDEDEDSEQNTSDTGRPKTRVDTPQPRVGLSFHCLYGARSRVDSEFQGVWRNGSVPNPGRVGQRSRDAGNRLGQLHRVPALLRVSVASKTSASAFEEHKRRHCVFLQHGGRSEVQLSRGVGPQRGRETSQTKPRQDW